MDAIILDNRRLTPRLAWLTISATEFGGVQAGQFVMARCAPATSLDPFLRRHLWIARIDSSDTVSLLLDSHETGARWLANQRPGATLDLLGPLGRAIPRDPQRKAILILAQGAGVGLALALAADAAATGAAVLLLTSTPADGRVPPFVLPPEVEYLSATDDVLTLLDTAAADRVEAPLLWADRIVAVGDAALAGQLAARLRRERFNWRSGLALFVPQQTFTCGVGLCGGCWTATRHGTQLVCTHGPAFDLRDLR